MFLLHKKSLIINIVFKISSYIFFQSVDKRIRDINITKQDRCHMLYKIVLYF
jgi:hypothetical protein